LKSILDADPSPNYSSRKRFVLLCGERGGKALPKKLKNELSDVLESTETRNCIFVVDSNWVSLSIACAKMLAPTNFKPNDAIDLWNLSKKMTVSIERSS